MVDNIVIIGAVALIIGIVLLVILEISVNRRKLLYALPAMVGTILIFVGLYLTDAPSWRNIAIGAFAIGAFVVLVSVFLLIFFSRRSR